MSYAQLLQRIPPLAIYSANDYNSDDQTLTDSGPNFNNAIVTGNQLQKTNENNMNYLIGNTGNVINFLTGRGFSTKFTICSITKFVDTLSSGCILHSKHNDIYHGHYNGIPGKVYYGSSPQCMTNITNIKPTSWVVCCAKTNGTIPNNVFINGSPSGVVVSSQMFFDNNNLNINGFSVSNSSPISNSNFAFSYLVVWDQELSDGDLQIVSNALNSYMQTGKIDVYNTPNINTGLISGTNLQFDQSKIPDIVDHQLFIENAVDNEINRMSDKVSTVKYGIDGQKRSINIDINYRKRYAAYLQIFIAFIIALSIYVVFASVDSMSYNISPLVMNSITGLIIFLCVMYSIYVYFQILRRQPNDFDKLQFDPPDQKHFKPTVQPDPSKIIHSTGTCEQASCCNLGTHWNSEYGVCVSNSINGAGFNI